MMDVHYSARLIFGFSAILLFGGVFQLVRKGLIREKHALLWIPTCGFFVIFGFFPNLLLQFSKIIRLHYITVVLLCVIIFYTFILLYFNVKLARLNEDVQKLCQAFLLSEHTKSKERPKH